MAKNTLPPQQHINQGEHSTHATVLVMGEEDWTPFERASHIEHDKARIYLNSRYQVAVYPAESPMDGWPRVVHISFKHLLNIAITDFRDMQLIKNELVGPKSYCIQIFPPEEMLVDTANQYHLWVFVPPSWSPDDGPNNWSVSDKDVDHWPAMPIGFCDGRVLSETPIGKGRQRTFDDEHLPEDLNEQQGKVHGLIAKREEMIKKGASRDEIRREIEGKSREVITGSNRASRRSKRGRK
jgi:hypothetical protein